VDRISALRNVEAALREFEAGEADLAATEERVVGVLRTYATEFEGDATESLDAYRATGDDPVDGAVVVAPSATVARSRVVDLYDADGVTFEVERV